MAIHIICPPGHYGGIISGRLDSKIGILPEEVAVFQRTAEGWSVRALGITAARLWSCDLHYDERTYVEEWMAAVVSKGFDPRRAPKAGDRVFQVTQEPASSLSVQLTRGAKEEQLEWTVWSGKPSRPDGLFRYKWWYPPHPVEEDEPFGWDAIDVTDPMDYGTPTWKKTIEEPAPQFAVLQVEFEHSNHFDPASRTDVMILPPSRLVCATAFTSCIDVKILAYPGRRLSGVVTGLGCAYDHVRKLGEGESPEEGELLRVSAWGIDALGKKTPIGKVLCKPSGYWVFDQLPAEAQDAVEFAIAVSMQKMELSLDALPAHGGEVIAFKRFKRTAMSAARELALTQ
jgi:hypothetical protein